MVCFVTAWETYVISGTVLSMITLPETPEQCMTFYTEWAAQYPTARFLVVTIRPDGNDAAPLGWGLALPDYVFIDLPEIGLTGRFGGADRVVQILGHTMDVRLVWVDPKPER